MVQPDVMCLTKMPLSQRVTSESVMRGRESSTQMPAAMARVAPLMFEICRFDIRPPELPQ